MRTEMRLALASTALALLAGACTANQRTGTTGEGAAAAGRTPAASQNPMPPAGDAASVRLTSSPRHSEWTMVAAGAGDSVLLWVAYPERATPAPVVVVIHEIFGLTPWIRSIADQLAAEGFIAVAPDFLTGKQLPGWPDSVTQQAATAAIRTLDGAEVQRRIDAAARYAMALPAALPRYGIVGFCWGGGVSFAHAAYSPDLGAAVVYYGTSPPVEALASVRAPVLGLYGENDARVNATIPRADSVLRAQGKTYTYHVYEGAGHGFLRQQAGQEGANFRATQQAWPATLSWFKQQLEG